MDGASIQTALERIEAAIARIERAAQPGADTAVRRKHERLRAAVAETLQQMDALLAAQQTPPGSEAD